MTPQQYDNLIRLGIFLLIMSVIWIKFNEGRTQWNLNKMSRDSKKI